MEMSLKAGPQVLNKPSGLVKNSPAAGTEVG